ncbi:MAG: hypothetical protein QG644_83, partial [Patescibacteria group bacterium]|nr:hypothetical protein [Patescibacteria group bacterium]
MMKSKTTNPRSKFIIGIFLLVSFLVLNLVSTYTASASWVSDPRPIPYGVIPKKPTGLTATPGGCGTGIINVSWNASVGATSYSLRDGATTIYTGASTSYSHTGLTASSSHSYTVLATNAHGSSAYTTAVVGTAPAVCGGFNLSVTKTGTGIGIVNDNLSQINCGAACSASYAPATSVTLSAISNIGSVFTGWSGGGCSGMGNCVVTMNSDISVNANFDGSGPSMSGTLTPSPASCNIPEGGSSCPVNLTWTTTNPVGVSGVTNNGTSVPPDANGNNGSQVFDVSYKVSTSGVTEFYLYNSSILLAQTDVITSCVAGTSWVTSKCTSGGGGGGGGGSPTASLDASPNVIDLGQPTTLTWS